MSFHSNRAAVISSCLTFPRFIELVNDHSNNKVCDEQRANNHEYDEEPNTSRAIVLDWLHFYTVGVHSDVCHSGPSLGCCQDEKGSHRVLYVVEVRVVLIPRPSFIEAVLLCFYCTIVI